MPNEKDSFENIVIKGENAGNQHFLLFPQCFLPYQKHKPTTIVTINLSHANAFNLVKAKILLFGNKLKNTLGNGV